MKKYWKDEEIKGEVKETWARIKCGSVGREGKRGYKNVKCWMCVRECETLEHVLECEEVEAEIKRTSRGHGKVEKRRNRRLPEKKIDNLFTWKTDTRPM